MMDQWTCAKCRNGWHDQCYGVRDNGDGTRDECACTCRARVVMESEADDDMGVSGL